MLESRASVLRSSFYNNCRVAHYWSLLPLLRESIITIKIAQFSLKFLILRLSLVELIIYTHTRGDNIINKRMFTVWFDVVYRLWDLAVRPLSHIRS